MEVEAVKEAEETADINTYKYASNKNYQYVTYNTELA